MGSFELGFGCATLFLTSQQLSTLSRVGHAWFPHRAIIAILIQLNRPCSHLTKCYFVLVFQGIEDKQQPFTYCKPYLSHISDICKMTKGVQYIHMLMGCVYSPQCIHRLVLVFFSFEPECHSSSCHHCWEHHSARKQTPHILNS